jgi:uncharacterized protein (TIGR03437 family)
VFSTFLNGHVSFAPLTIFAAEPPAFLTQNWISAVALDPAGNIVVGGGTRSEDFLTEGNAGGSTAFAASLSADGSRLIASSSIGGTGDDGALAVAADTQGNVIIAGQTWSFDFPVLGGVQPPTGLGEAFVAKFAPAVGPVITEVVNGASFQPGIESGSWVTIRGTRLAGAAESDSNLPTSLLGVSVTINGRAAFVYYVSPTQINVLAPQDTTIGPVQVVVTNRSVPSLPATARLQSAAPAFFQYGGTSYAVATRFPDNAVSADPAAVPGTVAAHPGDVLTLWGTGFGATNPPSVPGIAVSGVPAVVAPVAVTVAGQPAEVISAVLAPGFAGLYQVAVRLPAGLRGGPAEVQASTAGSSSPSGVMLYIGQ